MKSRLFKILLSFLLIFCLLSALACNAGELIVEKAEEIVTTPDEVEMHTNLEGISAISVSVTSSDIVIVESTSDLGVKLRTEAAILAEKPELEMSVSDDTLNIQVVHPNTVSRSGSWAASSLEIALPSSYTGDLYIHNVSGDIDGTLTNTLSVLDIQTTSGNASITLEEIDQLSLRSTSGNMNIRGDVTTSLEAESISGDINVNKLATSDTDVSVVTTSGNISISYQAVCPTEVSTTSGTVTLTLPADAVIDLSFSSISGDMRGEVSIDMDGVEFSVETISGNLNIE